MPTNQRTNSSRTRVDEPSRRSREFHVEQDGLTLEVVHAAELLKNYFEGLGCEDWILMGVCSRKLLERVNERRPNPGYITVPPNLDMPPEPPSDLGRWTGGTTPVPGAHETFDEHHFVYPNGTRVTARTVEEVQRIRRIVDGDMMMGQQHAVDPHPYGQIMEGPPPTGLMPEEAQRWQQHFRTLSPAQQMQRTYDDYMNRTQPLRERVVQETHMSAEEFNEMNHQALVNQAITELGPVTGSQPAPEDTPF